MECHDFYKNSEFLKFKITKKRFSRGKPTCFDNKTI
jgi:hypothetical protein